MIKEMIFTLEQDDKMSKSDMTKMSVEFTDNVFIVEHHCLTIIVTEIWSSNDFRDEPDEPRFDWDELSARTEIWVDDTHISDKIWDFSGDLSQELKEAIKSGMSDYNVIDAIDDVLAAEVLSYLEYLSSMEAM